MPKKLKDDGAANQKPNLSPDTFQEHYRFIRAARVDLDQARSDYQATRKRAKAAGIDLDALAMMERLDKLDEADVTARMRKLHWYATWANMPWGSQADMFAGQPVPQPTEKSQAQQKIFDAQEDGRFAGAGGESRDEGNTYPAGSELHAAYDHGWREGKVLHDKRKEEAGADETKPRGRKKAAGNPEDRPAA